MKHVVIIGLIGVLALSCKHKKESYSQDFKGNRLALLQVDYQTFAFEGGKEFIYEEDSEGFTIRPEYKSPGDFGSIKLYYDEQNSLIFNGSIIWMGTGQRYYPEILTDSDDFDEIDTMVEMPSTDLFNGEFEGAPSTELSEEVIAEIWQAIDNLKLVAAYRETNPSGKVNIYCYRPSVGMGDPADWDWLVFLKN